MENPVTVRKRVQLEFWAKSTKLLNTKKKKNDNFGNFVYLTFIIFLQILFEIFAVEIKMDLVLDMDRNICSLGLKHDIG